MVAYSCNLACRGCISLSDHARDGIEPYQSLCADIGRWKHLLIPDTVSIFGGEPCLHPRLVEICRHIRLAWPNSLLRLITNGLLLDRFEPSAWFDLAPFEMQVSVHRRDIEPKINQNLLAIMQQRSGWKVSPSEGAAHEQLQWQIPGVRIYKSIFKDFIEPYRRLNGQLIAWHSDPAKAHAVCGSPASPVLHRGKLYKCPAVAGLIDVTGENWSGYQPCQDADTLDEFCDQIGRSESVCGQCPDLQSAVIYDHSLPINVHVKQKNID
jgi:sulfatase maturation enzyme AslB (radical SAM superfamily)